MKIKFTILAIFICFIANARFEKATILFTDGHTENGFIKSFLEEKVINFSISTSLEHDLNLYDKTIQFKTSEEGELKAIGIDDINEVILFHEDGNSTTFRVIILKEITARGEITDSGRKAFLPYVKKGKINIYGIKFTENGSTPSGHFQSNGMRFYYHNEKENYAINYQNFNAVSMMYIKQRMINPFKDLFKDCPALMEKLNTASEGKLGFFKMDKESKEKLKEFKKMDRKEREKLAIYHHYNFYSIEKMIKEYEECN